MTKKNLFKKIGIVAMFVGMAAVGMLTLGFFAVRWHWTDVAGVVDSRSGELGMLAKRITEMRRDTASGTDRKNQCRAVVMGTLSAINAQHILDAYSQTKSSALLANMVDAASVWLTSDQKRQLLACESTEGVDEMRERQRWSASTWNLFPWMNTVDWITFKEAAAKDKDVVARVAQETNVEPRLIIAQLVAEQLRLFNSDREVYKKFFAPLKILGSETKFSLGVTGVKEATAIAIENNLKDVNSQYYLGEQYEHLLDFKTANSEKERYDRITDARNHYYAYLYTALYLKEIMQQWENAGYDISNRPEILSTLFNIGFNHSKPKPNPETGGAMIEIAGEQYSFGSIGYEFYYSGEMMDAFPYE